jgi:hypothetical protein
VAQQARQRGRQFGTWVVSEALAIFVCHACDHPVNVFDRVCNQCGTGDPARLSRNFSIFLGVAGFVLIFTLLWLFAF